MTSQHVVIGTGKFALGFVGDLFCRVGGLSTTFISRLDSNRTNIQSVVRDLALQRDKSYTILYDDRTSSKVSGFDLYHADFIKPGDDIIEIFCGHDLTLISVVLPESAFSDASFMIVSGLRERLKRFPDKDLPLILTFANAESNGDKLLAMMLTLCLDEPLESKLNKSCPNCVIDRICTAIVVDEKGVSITAERYALMVLETIYCCNTLSSVAEKWEIEFKRPILKSVSSLHVWQKLKYWGLNGLHLFLASAANTPLYPGFPSNFPIRIADVISNPRIRSLVDGFAAEVSLAIRSQAPGQIERNEAKNLLINSLHRVSQTDDTTSRILSSLSLDNSSIVQILQRYGFPVDSPYSLEDIAHDIQMDTIGYFLQKVEVRILDCAFVLAGDDEVHPINLLMGSLCILKALAVRARQ